MSYRTWCARLAAIAVLASLSTVSLSVTPAEAQFGKRLKERLKKNAEDKAIEKAVEKEDEAIESATTGETTEDTARATAAPTEPGSTATVAAAGAGGAATPAAKKVWANYDFIPGQRTLFFTDFTEDQVGNFPQRLEFKTGAIEVVEFEGGQRALRASSQSDFVIPLPEVLPDRYTIELDVTGRAGLGVGAETIKIAGGNSSGDNKFSEVAWGHGGFYLLGGPVQINLDTKDRERYLGKAGQLPYSG